MYCNLTFPPTSSSCKILIYQLFYLIIVNDGCTHFLNSLHFCGMDGNLWRAGCSLQATNHCSNLKLLASPSASSIILIATERCDRFSNSQWRPTAQRNTAGFFSLPLFSTFLFCFFYFFSSENLPSRWTHTLVPLCQPCETRVWFDDAVLLLLCSPQINLSDSCSRTCLPAPFPHCPHLCFLLLGPVCPVELVSLGVGVGSMLECSDYVTKY